MDKQKNFDFGYEIPAEFEAELSSWNDRDVAFIKSDYQNGKDMLLIYAADGTKLATTDNRDYAFIVAKQNNLTPRSVH